MRRLILSLSLVAVTATAGFAQTQAQINATIQKAARHILSGLKPNARGGEASISCYALLKANVPANNQIVAGILNGIAGKVQAGRYTPSDHGYYEAASDLMALEAADPKAKTFKSTMEKIVEYIEAGQLPSGGWFYPNSTESHRGGGDTSITQYAILGLWAAKRAGITVKKSAFDAACSWHLRTQRRDGGWGYHPGAKQENKSKHTLVCAGIGSLVICMRELYPGSDLEGNDGEKPKKKKKKNGPLEEVDIDKPPPKPGEKPKVDPNDNYRPKVAISSIKASVKRAVAWLNPRFAIAIKDDWPMYYIYGLERAMALANIDTIGGVNWYQAGAAHLIKTQLPQGHWRGTRSGRVSAAFGILFLVRATGKLIKRKPKGNEGKGLQKGRNGIPNFGEWVKDKNGEMKKVKKLGPLDELLTALQDPTKTDLDTVTEAIIEKVQIGDREKLIGQKNLLIKYADHPSVDVRRVAYWALGRCEDMKISKILVKGLADPDLDAAVEARNALCVLSRRPKGLISESEHLPNMALMTDAQKLAAAKKWRNAVQKAWQTWYFKNRPYDQRNDLEQLKFQLRR